MAKLILHGACADVELTTDPEDGQVIAACVAHCFTEDPEDGMVDCSWIKRYDDLNDASEYAADHADRGTV
jgi:hypothetical protein